MIFLFSMLEVFDLPQSFLRLFLSFIWASQISSFFKMHQITFGSLDNHNLSLSSQKVVSVFQTEAASTSLYN